MIIEKDFAGVIFGATVNMTATGGGNLWTVLI